MNATRTLSLILLFVCTALEAGPGSTGFGLAESMRERREEAAEKARRATCELSEDTYGQILFGFENDEQREAAFELALKICNHLSLNYSKGVDAGIVSYYTGVRQPTDPANPAYRRPGLVRLVTCVKAQGQIDCLERDLTWR